MIDWTGYPLGYVVTYGDGTFEPSEPVPGAIYAKMLPVRDRDGAAYDLVAWEHRDPWRWWLRHGRAVVLGEDDLEAAWWEEVPLYLCGTPAEWLEERHLWPNKRWACVLDWAEDPRITLGLAHEIRCTSAALATKLRQEIARHECRMPFRIGRAAA